MATPVAFLPPVARADCLSFYLLQMCNPYLLTSILSGVINRLPQRPIYGRNVVDSLYLRSDKSKSTSGTTGAFDNLGAGIANL